MNNRKLARQIVETVVNKLLIGESEDYPEVTFDNVQELLDQGYNPLAVFDWVYRFKDGIAIVVLDGEHNFINEEGKIISEQWFDDMHNFVDGLAVVRSEDYKYNYIDTEGNILSERWFDVAYDFYNGFGVVVLNDERYKIDQEGNIIK